MSCWRGLCVLVEHAGRVPPSSGVILGLRRPSRSPEPPTSFTPDDGEHREAFACWSPQAIGVRRGKPWGGGWNII